MFLADVRPVAQAVIQDHLLIGRDWAGIATIAGGVPAPKSLFAHTPVSSMPCRLIYALDPSVRGLRGRCGITVNRRPATPQTFVILADDKELWRSRPVQDHNLVQVYEVPLTGVKRLELRVECPGNWGTAWANWFDPQLLPAKAP